MTARGRLPAEAVSADWKERTMQKKLAIGIVLWCSILTSSWAEEPILIAHRGLLRHAPENTMPAFAACVELSIGFELDIYSSRDDRLVVIHNPTLKATTNGPDRPVRDLTVAELKRLDAGSWFHPSFRGVTIPTFEEVLAMVAQRKRAPTILAINVKQVTLEGERQLVSLVAKHGLLGESFAFDQNDACSRRLKGHDPAFRIGQNVGRQNLDSRLAADDLDVFLLTFLPTAEEVARIHGKKKQAIFNFSGPGPTRRDPNTWDRIRQVSLDGLLTDFPVECRLHWRHQD